MSWQSEMDLENQRLARQVRIANGTATPEEGWEEYLAELMERDD